MHEFLKNRFSWRLQAHLIALASSLFAAACSDGPPTASGFACGGCAADELCVQYYDGTCTPMSATCRKVSAACLTMATSDSQSCTKAEYPGCQYEICQSPEDGGSLRFMCGSPTCPNEVAGTDIGCYGP
jgi:hypothetical protein